MRDQFKRDFKFWDTKHTKSLQESCQLRGMISSLEYWVSIAPKKRYPGELREVKSHWGEGKVRRTNRRQFCYRFAQLWERHHSNWLCRVTKLRKLRERQKMLDTTKIPYYRQRIEAFGRKPSLDW